MGWFDPVDCLAARDALQAGNALEAGRLLLKSPQREHRAARRLFREIATALVEQAAAAYAAGDLVAAGEEINCAKECVELPADAAALLRKISGELGELRRRREWESQRLAWARAWADEGRVRSAIGLLKPLSGGGDAQRLELDLEERLARMERYVREARELLTAGDLTAARRKLRMAQAIHAADPQVIQLARELSAVKPAFSGDSAPMPPSRPIADRLTRFAISDHALVVSKHEIAIGSPKDSTVDVPTIGPR